MNNEQLVLSDISYSNIDSGCKVLITHPDCRCGFFHPYSECQKDDNGNPVGEQYTINPNEVHSSRARYRDLAISYTPVGDGKPISMNDFVEAIDLANGETYDGYKGGEYTMNSDTPVWIDYCEGSTDYHPIIGIEEDDIEDIVWILVPRDY